MYKFKDIIEEVKEFNTDLKYGLDDIVGVTIEKGLIPTIANLTQTALDKFYIIKPGTFVYNPRTHGVRLGMGYNNTCNTYITSWNNIAFKVKDTAHSIVTPKYLWLFFCKPIWDRLTNFLAWGSSTIVFAWKDFLDIEIDLPPIEKQREIVSEYETLTRRIRLNEQMIEKLEATAQALYRHTFVDNIDKQNLPQGWHLGILGEVVECHDSKRRPVAGYDREKMDASKKIFPYYGAAALMDYVDDYIFDGEYILMGEDGTVINEDNTPVVQYVRGKFWVNNHAHILKGKNGFDENLLYLILENADVHELVTGGVQAKINQENMMKIPVTIPPQHVLESIKKQECPVFHAIYLKQQENIKLTELQSLLLAKMGQ